MEQLNVKDANGNDLHLDDIVAVEVDSLPQIGLITAYAKGWLSIKIADGSIHKFRAKDVELCEERKPKTMQEQLREARKRYTKSKSYSGKASAHNGDDLASLLSGCTPAEAMLLADLVMEDTDEGEFKSTVERYSHLNPGQQRMNSGNLIRARVKKGLISIEQVAEHYAAMVPADEEQEEA